MKISFVIPAHNEEQYLGNCLTVLQVQIRKSRSSAEIIVVNNASTDNTKEIASSFPGVKVIDEKHKGLARARQAGFRASTGELIANIDADSNVPTGWIETVEYEFATVPNLVVLSGPYVYYDLSSARNFLVRTYYYHAYVFYILHSYILRIGSMVQGGNFVVRREALERAGGYDQRFAFYGEDTDVARRFFPLGRVKFSFKLKMHTSGRRLVKEGFFRMGARYGLNYFWTMWTAKPFTKSVKPHD